MNRRSFLGNVIAGFAALEFWPHQVDDSDWVLAALDRGDTLDGMTLHLTKTLAPRRGCLVNCRITSTANPMIYGSADSECRVIRNHFQSLTPDATGMVWRLRCR